ncbi:MAG: hypothetical protein K8S87_04925, partial [Planctomycetes bacterium]|nr:hypothetical protein [Planctomycetota bacterium]
MTGMMLVKRINGGHEPSCLTTYRRQPGAVYDGPGFAPVKIAIRKQRMKEQNNLCCYCQQKLSWNSIRKIGTVVLEHWQSQSRYPNQQLIYSNIIASCSGNSWKDEHCDNFKGDRDLKYNPATNDVANHIYFNKYGEISSSDSVFNNQLGKPKVRNNADKGILNLNCAFLVNRRKAKIKAIQNILGQFARSARKPQIIKQISRIQNTE